MLKKFLIASAAGLLLAACHSSPRRPARRLPRRYHRPTPCTSTRPIGVVARGDRDGFPGRRCLQAGCTAVAVRGHADTVGNPEFNLQLSRQRADAVKDALQRNGVPAAAILTGAVGEHDLPVPTADNVPERRNRSVDMAIARQALMSDADYCRALMALWRRTSTASPAQGPVPLPWPSAQRFGRPTGSRFSRSVDLLAGSAALARPGPQLARPTSNSRGRSQGPPPFSFETLRTLSLPQLPILCIEASAPWPRPTGRWWYRWRSSDRAACFLTLNCARRAFTACTALANSTRNKLDQERVADCQYGRWSSPGSWRGAIRVPRPRSRCCYYGTLRPAGSRSADRLGSSEASPQWLQEAREHVRHCDDRACGQSKSSRLSF